MPCRHQHLSRKDCPRYARTASALFVVVPLVVGAWVVVFAMIRISYFEFCVFRSGSRLRQRLAKTVVVGSRTPKVFGSFFPRMIGGEATMLPFYSWLERAALLSIANFAKQLQVPCRVTSTHYYRNDMVELKSLI
jgi:hypothetical protein